MKPAFFRALVCSAPAACYCRLNHKLSTPSLLLGWHRRARLFAAGASANGSSGVLDRLFKAEFGSTSGLEDDPLGSAEFPSIL